MNKAEIRQVARWSRDHLAFNRFIAATNLCREYKRTSRVRGKVTPTPLGVNVTVTHGPFRTTEKVTWDEMTSFNVDHLNSKVRQAFATMIRLYP